MALVLRSREGDPSLSLYHALMRLCVVLTYTARWRKLSARTFFSFLRTFPPRVKFDWYGKNQDCREKFKVFSQQVQQKLSSPNFNQQGIFIPLLNRDRRDKLDIQIEWFDSKKIWKNCVSACIWFSILYMIFVWPTFDGWVVRTRFFF